MRDPSPNKEHIANALRDGFGGGNVLVVGDIMLDQYLWGTIERVSPEAPTPILHERRQSTRAGGAGNVAANLAGLGLNVSIAGFVGNDQGRGTLDTLFAERGVDTSAIVTLADRPTTTKMRVIAGHQHVVRLDTEDSSDVGEAGQRALLDATRAKLGVDAIVVSDYAKGVVSPSFCQQLIEIARQSSTPVLVKPKGQDFSKYAGASALVLNRAELAAAANVPATCIDELLDAARTLVDGLGLQFIALTLGSEGITLIGPDQTIHLPARVREVFDVSGAGDTVIASIAASLCAGLDYVDMLHLTNVAAGFVVGRVGTVVIEQASLLRALYEEDRSSSAIMRNVEELLPLAETWRSAGQRIAYAEGAFDGLRAGDVKFLSDAAVRGDKLVVGVIANAGREGQSGTDDQFSRASVIASLTQVDAVIMLDTNGGEALMDILAPDAVANREESQ